MDLFTNKTLIASQYFQKIQIPNRADDLASRLSDALQPLLELQISPAGSSTKVLEKWASKRNSIKRVFEKALRIKTTALVSHDVYEVILPARGDVFDERLMSEDGKSALTGLRVVRLAVAPGLRGFEFQRQQVDYNSFRLPGSSAEQKFDLIRKAMVVLE